MCPNATDYEEFICLDEVQGGIYNNVTGEVPTHLCRTVVSSYIMEKQRRALGILRKMKLCSMGTSSSAVVPHVMKRPEQKMITASQAQNMT